MGSVNSYNPQVDLTVQIFDRFYEYEATVSSLEYDAVYSYFRSVFGTADAAGNFTVTLFRIAEQSDIPVMDLLEQIEGTNQADLNLTLAYYLNNIRSPATLLGINATTTPNYYAARNVRS
jgi:pyruvate/2-oxoacid:ferredoxin oxidoreductase alpha subunit